MNNMNNVDKNIPRISDKIIPHINQYIKILEDINTLSSDLLNEYKIKNRLIEQSFVVCDKCTIK